MAIEIPATMRAPVFLGEGKLRYEDRPTPQVRAADDVLLRIEACGICGTDLNILATPPAHKATPGIIIGHEGVGIVARSGRRCGGWRWATAWSSPTGSPAASAPTAAAGWTTSASTTRPSARPSTARLPPICGRRRGRLWKIDPAVPRDDAALFEPLACAVGAVKRAPFQAGDNVAIIGAGPMGLLFALLYRALGAGQMILLDLAPYRLEFARQIGMDAALDVTQVDAPAEVKRLTGLGADIVVDAVGNQIDQAIHLARRGGQVILFGLRAHDNPPVNQYTITRYDLTLHGAFVGLHPFAQTIQLLESRRVQPSILVTHRLPLAELEHGVELMRTQQAMKVLVEM
jgi:threonine dehydrogenase-like Zn-dependent dehydrogenase